jgi:hypothetical protein
MDDEHVEVIEERARERWVGDLVVSGELLERPLGLDDAVGVERGPVAALDLALEPLGQLRDEVPQFVDRAALGE